MKLHDFSENVLEDLFFMDSVRMSKFVIAHELGHVLLLPHGQNDIEFAGSSGVSPISVNLMTRNPMRFNSDYESDTKRLRKFQIKRASK